MKQLNLNGKEQKFFIDDDGNKRPLPPDGYIRYEPRIRKNNDNSRQRLCPVCGCPWGTIGAESGWVDEKIQSKYDKAKKENKQFPPWPKHNGESIRNHWSKYRIDTCSHCGVKMWKDEIPGKKFHYYNPSTADKSVDDWEEPNKELRSDGGIKND